MHDPPDHLSRRMLPIGSTYLAAEILCTGNMRSAIRPKLRELKFTFMHLTAHTLRFHFGDTPLHLIKRRHARLRKPPRNT